MTLKPCPRCARLIEHLSTSCPSCGWRRADAAAPDAPVATPDAAAATHVVAAPPFFAVPPLKLAVLSFCTFGLYNRIWSYRMWARLQARTGADVSPFWRSVFFPIFSFSLFGHVEHEARRARLPVWWNAGLLGTAYLACSLAWRLHGAWFLIGLLDIVPVYWVAQTVRAMRALTPAAPDVAAERFGLRHWAIVVLGLLLLTFAAIGALQPQGGA